MSLKELLGNEFVDKKGNKFDSSRLDGKTVGIYFSAHWCPPCKMFTPKLAEQYEVLSQKHPFEVVFVSSDRDQGAFDEYLSEMPWIAVPFSDRDRKNSLSSKYKVRGIPSLVIVDSDGKTITTKGREAVMSDPEGFPWTPKTFAQTLGTEFVRPDGSNASIKDLDGKVLGLYFSAHWCPPCKAFTPKFAEVYKKCQAAGKKFEVVFVSSDRDKSQFESYHKSMPWLAVPYDDRNRASALSDMFEVEGIPSLVILDVDRTVINASAVGSVSGDSEGAEFPWHPKPLMDISEGAEFLNEERCLVFLMESLDDPSQDAAKKAALEIAEKYASAAKAKKEDPEFRFMYVSEEDDISSQIRSLTGLKVPEEETQMLLMDIPDNGGFYVNKPAELTAEGIEAFLSEVREKKAERKQLSRG